MCVGSCVWGGGGQKMLFYEKIRKVMQHLVVSLNPHRQDLYHGPSLQSDGLIMEIGFLNYWPLSCS